MSITKKIELVPTMTSNTSAGVAFGSGVLSASYNFFMAFDKNVATAWCSNSVVSHLGYNFNNNTYLNAYSLTCRNLNADDITSMVKSWTFEGSNDGISWTILDTQKNHTWEKSQEKIFNLSALVNYSQYRVNITENNGYASASSIGEFNLIWFKNVGIVLKNPTTNKHYSLSDKTLIHLPDASNKNMISYGIEQGKEIQLDVPFTKHFYVNEAPIEKVFTQQIGSSNTLKMKELKKDYTPIFTWHKIRMTSNTAPSPLVASASSVYSDPRYLEYRAFNGTTADANDAFIFASGILTGWLQLDFGKNTQVSSIGITSINNSSSTTSTPKDMKLQGSLDGIAFEDIYTLPPQTGWNANETRTFNLGKKNNYRFYRLVVDSNNGYASYTAIGQLVFGSKREVN